MVRITAVVLSGVVGVTLASHAGPRTYAIEMFDGHTSTCDSFRSSSGGPEYAVTAMYGVLPGSAAARGNAHVHASSPGSICNGSLQTSAAASRFTSSRALGGSSPPPALQP